MTLPRYESPVLDLRVTHTWSIVSSERDAFNSPVKTTSSRATWAGIRPLAAGDDLQAVGDSQIPIQDFDLYVRHDGAWRVGHSVTINESNYLVLGVSARPRDRYAVLRIRQIGG